MLILCDIDGVLADCSHRLNYLEEKDYLHFYAEEEILKDTPIKVGIEFLEALLESPLTELYYLTGRPFRTEEATNKWLEKYNVPKAPMLMRKDHDFRKSEIVKAEILQTFLANYDLGDESAIFIDDDPLNVAGVCKELPHIKGIVFGAERLKRARGIGVDYKIVQKREIEELSNKALDEYKLLVESDLFTQDELEGWVSKVVDDYPNAFGLPQADVGRMVGTDRGTMSKWRSTGVTKATWANGNWLYLADEIIKLKGRYS